MQLYLEASRSGAKRDPCKYCQRFYGMMDATVLWEGFLNFIRVGNRLFWELGRPRGPRRPFQNVGGFAPHLLQAPPGPPGPPRPPIKRLSTFYSLLRNITSGPEIGLPGRIVTGLLPGKPRNRPAGRPAAGRRADFCIFVVAVRPKSGPEGRFPARKHY